MCDTDWPYHKWDCEAATVDLHHDAPAIGSGLQLWTLYCQPETLGLLLQGRTEDRVVTDYRFCSPHRDDCGRAPWGQVLPRNRTNGNHHRLLTLIWIKRQNSASSDSYNNTGCKECLKTTTTVHFICFKNYHGYQYKQLFYDNGKIKVVCRGALRTKPTRSV